MAELAIREIKASDVPRLVALDRKLFAREGEIFGYSDEGVKKEIREYRLARFIGKLTGELDRKLFVGEINGVAVGTTMVNRLSDSAWYVSFVMVDPDYQGKGFGRRILEHATEEVRGQGGQRAILHVRSDNQGAKNLYVSAGFKEFEGLVFYAKDLSELFSEPFSNSGSIRKVGWFDVRTMRFIDSCREPSASEVYGSTLRPNSILRLYWRFFSGEKYERYAVILEDSWVALYQIFLPSQSEAARLRLYVPVELRGKVERNILLRALKLSLDYNAPKLVVTTESRRDELIELCRKFGFRHVYSSTAMVKSLAK